MFQTEQKSNDDVSSYGGVYDGRAKKHPLYIIIDLSSKKCGIPNFLLLLILD